MLQIVLQIENYKTNVKFIELIKVKDKNCFWRHFMLRISQFKSNLKGKE